MTADRGRYAIYFSPDRDSALGIFGRHWLGYDADSGEATEQSALATLSPQRLAEITAEPSRYGFHATLKPPFVLAACRSDATGLFHQPAPEEHFRLVRRYRLAGTISTLGS